MELAMCWGRLLPVPPGQAGQQDTGAHWGKEPLSERQPGRRELSARKQESRGIRGSRTKAEGLSRRKTRWPSPRARVTSLCATRCLLGTRMERTSRAMGMHAGGETETLADQGLFSSMGVFHAIS